MTWDEIARHFGVTRCDGCPALDHVRGQTSFYAVHWYDRRMTKLGLRRYLMLISELRLVYLDEEYMRIYASNRWAADAARQLHIRIPARYSDNDRARVRWLIEHKQNVPDGVRRWARGRTA